MSDSVNEAAPSWLERCGGRYGIVPADVLADTTLSRGARLLFAVLCTNAGGRDDTCQRSMPTLARDLGVSKKTAIDWMRELECAGRVVKLSKMRQLGTYKLVRALGGGNEGTAAMPMKPTRERKPRGKSSHERGFLRAIERFEEHGLVTPTSPDTVDLVKTETESGEVWSTNLVKPTSPRTR